MQSCGIYRGAAPAARFWQSCRAGGAGSEGQPRLRNWRGNSPCAPRGLGQVQKCAGRAGRAPRAGAVDVRAAAYLQPFQGTLGNTKKKKKTNQRVQNH